MAHTAKTRSKPKKAIWLLWIGQAASFLCLIHCLATVALTFIAPSLLTQLPHNYWVESAAWLFVILSSLFLLTRAPKKTWHVILLAVVFVWGTVALIVHSHSFFTAAFMSLAFFQLYLTLSHHLHGHTEDECCHVHDHHPHHSHKEHKS